MSRVFRTFNIRPPEKSAANAIAMALGGYHVGMFEAPLLGDEALAFVASGLIPDDSPLLQGKDGLTAALQGSPITEEQISSVINTIDLSDKLHQQRAAELSAEISATVSAIDWVQPTGAQDAIELGAIRKHNGKTWVSLQDANASEPGVASWRETWSTTTDTPPDWVQPAGSEDAYKTGERVSHAGTTWHTLRNFNTREPGTFDAGWIDENASVGDEWAEGVAYSVGDEVTYEGDTYRCIQAHTSISVWIPPNVPALWELI